MDEKPDYHLKWPNDVVDLVILQLSFNVVLHVGCSNYDTVLLFYICVPKLIFTLIFFVAVHSE